MKPNTFVCKIGPYNYLPEDILGQGSSGKVLLGLHTHTQEKVAIKIINMADINNEVTHYLLNCEKQALLTINHPHVLKAFNIYQEKHSCNIITSYCEGGNLKEYILKKKSLPQKQALQLFYKLLKGYKSIKDNHFVHRDLKSSNIMLKNSEPIIIDFGYCEKTYGEKPKVFYNVGSPSYMSPEAFYKTSYSEKSDVWSLGIILFEMLSGYTIDRGQPINRYFSSLVKNGYRVPKTISFSCQQILDSALKINPQQRARTIDLIKMAERYLQQQEVSSSKSFSTSTHHSQIGTISQNSSHLFEHQQQSQNMLPRKQEEKSPMKKSFSSLKNSITNSTTQNSYRIPLYRERFRDKNDKPQVSQSIIVQRQVRSTSKQQPHSFRESCQRIPQLQHSNSSHFSVNSSSDQINAPISIPNNHGRKELYMAKMTDSIIQGVPATPEIFERPRTSQSLHIKSLNSLHSNIEQKSFIENPQPPFLFQNAKNQTQRSAFIKKQNPANPRLIHWITQQPSTFFSKEKYKYPSSMILH